MNYPQLQLTVLDKFVKMPGTRCTVAVCNNSFERTKKAGLKVLYHNFPKYQPVRNIWIERCGRGGRWNPDSCHVCSMHFTKDDYVAEADTKRLRTTAIPTMFLTESPPINIKLKTPRKKRKLSLNDKTPTYSNQDNIISSPKVTSSSTNTTSNCLPSYELCTIEDSKKNKPFYVAAPKNENLAGIDLENLQCYHASKHKKNGKLETQDESCYTSNKQCIILRNVSTETAPDYFIENYKSLMDENEQLRSELIQLSSKHQKLLLNMKYLESKIENLKLNKLIQEL